MLIATYLAAVEQSHADLTAWDQAAGDGDFGDNLRDGLRASAERIPAGANLAGELAAAAEWFLDHVGGTSGPLFGLLFDAMARRADSVTAPGPGSGAAAGFGTGPGSGSGSGSAGATAPGMATAVDRALVGGLADGAAAIQRVGEAHVGDRTMIDALVPAVEYLQADANASDSGAQPAPGAAVIDWQGAAQVALQGALHTATIRARMGRASYLGDRAVGTPDPGAMGVALLFRALAVTRSPDSVDAGPADTPRR